MGECCKLPHWGPTIDYSPTPYSIPAGEEISSFLRLGGCGPAFNSTDSDSGHSEVYVLAILTLYDRESSCFAPAVIITFAAAENNHFTWYRINCWEYSANTPVCG